jgi:RNA polymerase sigma factor (sigma-70 family)
MEKDFTAWINTHRGTIYKVCNVYGRDEEYKKDLFQEIVLQLWKSYPSFRKEAKDNTWIYRVALNTAISNFKKELRKPGTTALTEAALQIPDISYPHEEQIAALLQAIEHLTVVEKALILLYLEEKSYDEIAAIMGITNSNVGVRLNPYQTQTQK